jgi:hypothetical protein
VAKPDPLNYQLVCRDCGLEAPVAHASLRECVDALQRERSRLSEHLRLGQLDTAMEPSISDSGASALSPRLTQIAERS